MWSETYVRYEWINHCTNELEGEEERETNAVRDVNPRALVLLIWGMTQYTKQILSFSTTNKKYAPP